MVALHQGGLVQKGKECDMVDMAEELLKGADNEALLRRREMAQVGEAVTFQVVGGAATVV